MRFYGLSSEEPIRKEIEKRKPWFEDCVEFYKRTSHEELVKNIARDNFLMLFTGIHSMVGTKTFDYIAVRRNVLLCFTDDPTTDAMTAEHYNMDEPEGFDRRLKEEVLLDTELGHLVKDPEDLTRVLEAQLQVFEQKGGIPVSDKDIEKYSRRLQTKKLVDACRSINNGKNT